jgi:hypothetical protein
MDWITDQIAIGDYHEAQDRALLRRHGFGSALGLISTLRGIAPVDLGLQRIEVVELLDGPGNDPGRFRRVVDLLTKLLTEAPPVFVHCRAGWSRSPAVVAGYLMQSQGLSANDAIAAVAAKRTFTMAPELRALLEQL